MEWAALKLHEMPLWYVDKTSTKFPNLCLVKKRLLYVACREPVSICNLGMLYVLLKSERLVKMEWPDQAVFLFLNSLCSKHKILSHMLEMGECGMDNWKLCFKLLL